MQFTHPLQTRPSQLSAVCCCHSPSKLARDTVSPLLVFSTLQHHKQGTRHNYLLLAAACYTACNEMESCWCLHAAHAHACMLFSHLCATATANLSLGPPLPVVLCTVLQVVANLHGLQINSTSQALSTLTERETAAGASAAPASAARLIVRLHTWTDTTRVR